MTERWDQLLINDFTAKDGDTDISAMAEFKGELYIGTGRSSPFTSANVYRLVKNGCKKWQKVSPPWSTATGSNAMAMAVFKNSLFVGTDQGEIWRTFDGESWTNMTGNLPKGSIHDMTEFNNHLYITGPGIYRSSGNSLWNLLATDFGEPQNRDTLSLEVFKGHLYAGVGRDNNKGIQLWRTTDGTNWVKFQEVIRSKEWPLGAGHVHALKAFKDNLYVGRYHGKGVWRTDGNVKPDGSPVVWEYIPAIQSGDVLRLEEHDQKLYLGVSLLWIRDADPLIYYSENGKQWKEVKKGGPSGVHNAMITSFLSYQGRLYIGTNARDSSESGSLVLWELGPKILPDQFEPNNKMATATPLKLGSTKTQTSIELSNLTLDGGYDEDFFEIEFQSTLAQECWNEPKTLPAPGGGGMFGVEHNQGYLSIHAQEEYCRPLHLEIYRTKDKENKLYKKYFTDNEIRIPCPSKVFEDKKFFLAIKPPDQTINCRYKLSVTFSNKSARIVGKPLYKFWESLPPPYPPPPFLKLIDPTIRYFDIDKFLADSEKYLSDFIDYNSQIEQANLRQTLGQTHFLRGSYDRAERFYSQSLSTFKELEIPTKEAEVLRSLGELNSAQGKTTEAVKSFENAAQIHQQLEDEEGLAYDLMALGHHYLRTGEYYESLIALEEALALQIRLPDMSGELLNFLDQSEAFLKLDQREVAVACHVLAKELSSRIEDAVMSQEVDLRRETIAAQIGEQEFLELEERLADRAATVRYEAISEILEGQNSKGSLTI